MADGLDLGPGGKITEIAPQEVENVNIAGKRAVLEQNLNYRDPHNVTNSVGLPLIRKENPANSSQLTKIPNLSQGVPSFINPYAVLTFPSKYGSGSSPFNSIIDDPSSKLHFSSPQLGDAQHATNIDPTVYNLVTNPPDNSQSVYAAKTPYRYTDFLYCKYYGKIPNNFLITLRRYPAPTFDNLGIPIENRDDVESESNEKRQFSFKPIAQAVTWMGEEPGNKMSEIMGFEVNMNWKKVESQVESVYGQEQSASEGPGFLAGAGKFLAIVNSLSDPNSSSGVGDAFTEKNARYDPYATGPYSNRVYGPVNVIAQTYKRDRGLDFKQTFNLNFEYSLKSIASINPKAAMLDIMANMLTLTYNNAAFWGGANRYFPNKPVIPFLGGKQGMNAWYSGDPVGFGRAVGRAVTTAGNQLSKLFTDLMADPIAALTKLAGGAPGLAMNLIGKGRAPDIVAFKALLTGEPIGEWHLVVGNPYAPTLRIGNLICTGAKFQFSDTVGADNFPTELKVSISLEHGRPRDQGDIESMFNDGNGRIYYAPADRADVFKSSATKNSTNDNSFKKGAAQIGHSQVEAPKGAFAKNKGNQSTGNVTNTFVGGKGVGAGELLNKTVDKLSYAFQGNGHALAVKMGLASGGGYTSADQENFVPPATTKGKQE